MNTWSGTLTTKNIDKVAHMILEMLQGKKYSFVLSYEYKRYIPETRLNQKLENGNNGSPLSIYHASTSSGFNFCDTYGVWGLSTSAKKERYDPDFNSPYIFVDYNQITITQRTGAGLIAYWQITVD